MLAVDDRSDLTSLAGGSDGLDDWVHVQGYDRTCVGERQWDGVSGFVFFKDGQDEGDGGDLTQRRGDAEDGFGIGQVGQDRPLDSRLRGNDG